MLKKLLAIRASLAMVLSLAACGSYEITIEKKDDEKVASDSVDEKEEEIEEDEDELEEEPEEEEETEAEEEDDDSSDNSKYLATKAEVKKFLGKYIDLDGYETSSDEDSYLSYGDGFYNYKKFDYKLKVNKKEISFPTDYDDVKALGLDFTSDMYNEKSEQNGNTTGMGWDFDVPGGGQVEIMSVNMDDYAKPITDLDFYGARVYGYGFENKKFIKSFRYSNFKINDTITADSTIEDVVNEFGTPSYIFVGFSENYTSMTIEYVDELDVYSQKLTFRFNYYNGKAYIEEIYYTYPEREI